MNFSRRDFMKLVGITAASLTLTNCKAVPVTCYAPLPLTPTATEPLTARDRLRLCWMRFGELAEATQRENEEGITENTLGQQLVAEHRLSLDDVVENGELTSEVADLVQEAYEAAVYHVWRSNAMITCYEPVIVDYAPSSAGVLVHQAEVLSEIAEEGTIDPTSLATAQAALEHDLAYYDMTEEEVANLYDRIMEEWQNQQQSIPGFEELELEITPEAKTAAQFIISLLTSK
jgi:hypothetical protein